MLFTAITAVLAWQLDGARQDARDRDARAKAVSVLRVFNASLESRLTDVANLFASSQAVTEQEFATFTAPIVRSGDADSIAWVQSLSAPELEALRRRLGSTARGLDAHGRVTTDRSTGRALIIRYVTRRTARHPVLGLNLLPDADRRRVILAAIRSGQVRATSVVRLVSSGRPGVVLYAPVSTRGVIAGTIELTALERALRQAVPRGSAFRVQTSGSDVARSGTIRDHSASAALTLAGQPWTVVTSADGDGDLPLWLIAVLLGSAATGLTLLGAQARIDRRMLATGSKARRRADERFMASLTAAPIPTALIRTSGRILHTNPALDGLAAADIAGTNALLLVDSHDREKAQAMVARAIGRPEAATVGELRVTTPGGVRWATVHVSYLEVEDLLLVQAIDTTEQRYLERRLVRQTERDPLTELLNRRGFSRVAGAQLDTAAHAGRTGGALLLIDLDHFSAVNDLIGHTVGDQALRVTAATLLDELREQDVIARLGADEFAALLPDADAEHAEAVARRLIAAIATRTERETRVGGGVSASVGIVVLGEGRHQVEQTLIAGDIAVSDAKDAGGRGVAFADGDERRSPTRERFEGLALIRRALAEGQFELHAQPIRDLSDGHVDRFELLVRLPDAGGEPLPPAAFLPVAERFGLIGEIDAWVVREAIAIAERHARHHLTFHVNLSGRSLTDPALLRIIEGELARSGLDPACLTFEVTETAAIVSPSEAQAFTRRLSDLGCGIALDDFGAGFASFAYLKQLPCDLLKLDGGFVRDCVDNRIDQVIIQGVLVVAERLGTPVVAEFVEDQRTEDLLREMGVQLVQGFHVGRPRPASQLIGDR